MSKTNLLKVVLVVILSILLIANLNLVVFAADDSFSSAWEENAETPTQQTGNDSTGTTTTTTTTDTTGTSTSTDVTGTSTTSTDTTGTSTSTDATGTSATDTDTTSSISTGSATTTLSTNEDEDENKNEVNSLAYTGIEDNKVLPVVIVMGAIVAGYSLRKVREYNNI